MLAEALPKPLSRELAQQVSSNGVATGSQRKEQNRVLWKIHCIWNLEKRVLTFLLAAYDTYDIDSSLIFRHG